MSVKGYLALLVGIFVAALVAVTATRPATATGRPAILVPALVTLAAVALAALLIRLVLRDIARPFHSAGANIRSNVDQLSAVVQRLAATTAEQSSGVAQTSATMEELARAAASIAETVDRVATQADTTRNNLEQAQFDIRASGERTLALADRVARSGSPSRSSTRSPIRPTSSPSTPPSRRPGRATVAAGSRWSPTRSAAWPSAPRRRRPTSPR
jgi:uncharacterized protein YukE